MGPGVDSGKDSGGNPPKLNRKKPVWGWQGETACHVCGEEVEFFREEGFDMETDHWVVQVFHDHREDPDGKWVFAVYNQYKGRQRPQIVKDANEQKSEAYKERIAQRRVENAGS